MKSISFDFVPKGKQKSDKMLFTNLLPELVAAAGLERATSRL